MNPEESKKQKELADTLIEKKQWKVFLLMERDILLSIKGYITATNIPEETIFVRAGYRLELSGIAMLGVNPDYEPMKDGETPEVIPVQWKTTRKYNNQDVPG